MLGDAISGIAIPIFEGFWRLGGKARDWASTQRKIRQASQQYHQRYLDRHGELKLLGMPKAIKLDSVYTPVQLLDESARKRFASVYTLEEDFRRSSHRSFQPTDSKQPGLEVAIEEQYLTVLGGPGAGKSTFLRKMGLEALNGQQWKAQRVLGSAEDQERKGLCKWFSRFRMSSKAELPTDQAPQDNQEQPEDDQCIPVFIELKKFSTGHINLEEFIAKEFDICGFPKAQEFSSRALKRGKLLILLDGLDEVPIDKSMSAIDVIQDFVDKYHKNRFIVSCRIAAYQSSFRRFSDITMAEFESQQIEHFIHKWFNTSLYEYNVDERARTANECCQLLQQSDYKAARDLARTPLLLTLLCFVYGASQTFPKNRATLYKEALEVFLRKWSTDKLVQRDPIYKDLNPDLEISMLSEIAYKGFIADQFFYPKEDLIEILKFFLSDNLNAPEYLDGGLILKTIEIQQGVLTERAQNIYSFSHLTFQEYLTAQYIIDYNKTGELVTQYLFTPRWREVFRLVPGLMRAGADKFILMMKEQAQSCIKTPNLKALLRWAEQITVGSEGNYEPAVKRVIAVYFASASASARDLALALALTSNPALVPALVLVLDLASALASACSLDLASARSRALASDSALTSAGALASANARSSARDSALASARELQKKGIFRSGCVEALIIALEALKADISAQGHRQLIEKLRAFPDDLEKAYFDTLQLSPEFLNLSNEEVRSLENYLKANELMVKCKEAAVRVSRQTWEPIEDRMLRLPPEPDAGGERSHPSHNVI